MTFFRASAISDLEYRLNLSVKFITDVIWYIAQLSVFEVLFRHTSAISGWTIETTRVFMGVLFIVDAVWMLLFSENLDRLSDKVRKGDLDLLLVKPVNAQFMLSFQRMNTAYLANLFLAVSWMIWALSKLPISIEPIRVVMLLATIPCGLAVAYSLRFLFSASALIFTRAENINYLWYQLYRLATRPDSIYPPWLRFVLLSVIPVGFIASVPSNLLLGTSAPSFVALSYLISGTALYVSIRYWRFALKFYSSASS